MAGFENPVHKTEYEKIRAMAVGLYGEKVVFNGQVEYEFCLRKGSTIVHCEIQPFPVQPGTYYVYVWAVCTYESIYSPLMARNLIDLNNKVFFGHFTFYEYQDKPGTGNIVFTYMFPALEIGKGHLDIGIYNVAYYADQYDDEFVQKYGGMTAMDAINKAGT